MRHLFDRPLGASAPNGFLFKRQGTDYGSVASAFLSFAGNQITNEMNAEQHASDMATYLHVLGKQREWQKQDQQWSEDASKRLFDYQNAYNSPVAQIARYKAAGVNPYLMMQQGVVGNGNSQGMPSPNPSTRASVSPFIRPDLGNPTAGLAENIFAGSSIRSQRITALADFAKSLPDLVKSVGKDAAKRIASNFLGTGVDMQRVDDMIQNEALEQQYKTKLVEVESSIKAAYGEKEAANVIALQEQTFNDLSSQIGLRASQGKLNEAEIKKLSSEYIRNLADAFKLKKEGDMYVASAAQYSAMAALVGLQGTRLKFENKANGYVDGSPLWNYLTTHKHAESIIGRYKNMDYLKGDAVGFWVDRFFNDYVKVLGSAQPSGGSSVTSTYSTIP